LWSRVWSNKAHLTFGYHGRQGGENDKLSFMILERGPWAFYQGAKRFIRSYFVEASPGQELVTAASARITERAAVLGDLRERLATISGQVYCLNSFRIPFFVPLLPLPGTSPCHY